MTRFCLPVYIFLVSPQFASSRKQLRAYSQFVGPLQCHGPVNHCQGLKGGEDALDRQRRVTALVVSL